MYFPSESAAHMIAFDGPVVDHWWELNIAQTANPSTMQQSDLPPELSLTPSLIRAQNQRGRENVLFPRNQM